MSNYDSLSYYLQMTKNTDPGDFMYLYENLPDNLSELCDLIKCQLIHPDMLNKIRHKLTVHTKNEDSDFCSVEEMLEALAERNANGIIAEREPCERLILSCRFHALLLISILRAKGRQARLRVGFAKYLHNNPMKYADHWVCEVWIPEEERWILVDPDIKIVDIQDDDFLLAAEAWLMVRNHEINPKLFGGKKWWGMYYIRNNLCHDLNSVMGHELRYDEHPPICDDDIAALSMEELQLLDEAAVYLQNVDENLDNLKLLYEANDILRFI